MGIRPSLLAIAVSFSLGTQIAQAQLTDTEKSLIDQVLKIGNLKRSDLLWDRRPFNDAWRMPFINDALDAPIETTDELLRLHRNLGNLSPNQMMEAYSTRLYKEKWPAEQVLPTLEESADIPPELRAIVGRLTQAIAAASSEVRASLSSLSDVEQRTLIEGLPRLAAEAAEIKFDFVKQPMPSRAELFGLAQKIDTSRIRAAGSRLALALQTVLPSLQRTASSINMTEPVTARIGGMIVRIHGKGSDIHDATDSSLTIDLGGNDIYRGRAGAGVANASVLLDLGGDDRYEGKDASIGAGLLGIGIARDVEGDDVYLKSSLSAGCGIAGVGMLVDTGGTDRYEHPSLAQGFGLLGVGILVDTKGDDFYKVGLYGQGCARTAGVGHLVDREGDDTYRAGGIQLNSPLFADVYYSFAQGCSMGYREDTGGISGGVGLLTDLDGRDAYLAETYAQAASYWLAVGSLYDAAGHDRYSGYHYCQASAMHLCASYLFDLSGDDLYAMSFGASHAIGHDYGVAVMLDRAGNDNYFAQDSVPGIGNANGLGLFIDVDGTDRYQGPPGRGNASRGSGSVGLFVDGNGQDVYRDGFGDGQSSSSDSWGFGVDLPTKRTVSTVDGPAKARPVPGSIPVPDNARMEKLYGQATQWAVGTAQAAVEEALSELVGIGVPAAQWMIDKKLAGADRLQQRAFVEVLRDAGTEARQILANKLLRGSLAEKRNGLGVASDGKFKEVGPAIPALIEVPELQLQAVRAAGSLNSQPSVPLLLPLAAQRSNLGLAAMVSLAQIGDERGYSTAEALLGGNLLLRKAALQLMVKFPLRATETGKRLLLDPDERMIRIGVELLGMVASEEALKEVASRLLDPSPAVRCQALLALNGQCPSDVRLTFMSLRNDPDPMVRAVAARVEPGR